MPRGPPLGYTLVLISAMLLLPDLLLPDQIHHLPDPNFVTIPNLVLHLLELSWQHLFEVLALTGDVVVADVSGVGDVGCEPVGCSELSWLG